MSDEWTHGGIRLSQRHREASAAAIEQVGGLREFELIVLGGSIFAGFGHALSDIDLYAVCDAGRRVSAYQHSVNGCFVQFNVVTIDELQDMASTFAEYSVTARQRDQLFDMHRHLKVASRLVGGEVLHARGEAGRLMHLLNREVMRKLLMTHHAVQVSRFAEDALGGLQAADPLIAIQAAELAAYHAVEVSLAAVGDVFVGESFHLRRLSRHDPGSGVSRPLWQARHNVPFDAAMSEVEQHVHGLLDIATHLTAASLLDGWSKPMAAVPAYRAPRNGLSRSHAFSVLRFGDKLSFAGAYQALRTNETTVRLWLEAPANESPDPLVTTLEERGLLTRPQNNAREEVERCRTTRM
jgi:hypothetical protein